MQIDFDPEQITYEQLLDLFWKSHNGCDQNGLRQYMSAVFYHDAGQKALAEMTRDREADRRGYAITTQLLPFEQFYRAEDYHQKYELRRHRGLIREFQAMYPDAKAFTDSTAAARINGLLAGHGKRRLLEKEIDRYGLSTEGQETLRKAVRN